MTFESFMKDRTYKLNWNFFFLMNSIKWKFHKFPHPLDDFSSKLIQIQWCSITKITRVLLFILWHYLSIEISIKFLNYLLEYIFPCKKSKYFSIFFSAFIWIVSVLDQKFLYIRFSIKTTAKINFPSNFRAFLYQKKFHLNLRKNSISYL